jgi:CheY-like chemotaxis protein
MSALRKVLVVDDDPVVGKSYNRVLSNKGYVVTTAENAREALEQMSRDEYDLVVTDIRMPGMSGLELAETVKARRPWTPVLIVTGYGDDADEKRARAAGVSGFLHKPLSPEMIEDSAAQALSAVASISAPAVQAVPLDAVWRDPAIASVAATVEAVTAEPTAETEASGSRIKDIALFLAAPFIGLVYAVFLPFVGLGMLAVMGGKALAKNRTLSRAGGALLTVGKFVFAPFIGLAYVIVMPFAGLATLAWIGGKALLNRKRAE